MASTALACFLIPIGAQPAVAGLPAGDGRGGFEAKSIGEFDNPVYAHGPSQAPRLLFVVEQPGRIMVRRLGNRRDHAFLDIRDRVECCGERGLLSVAFDPEYERNRRFYVYFTENGGDIRVEQYLRRKNRPLQAFRDSRRKVIEIEHSRFANHNGGLLQFGPDGRLYLATGDGGGGGDPFENAQDPGSLLGKLLRIDPLSRGGYTVPDSNPFADRRGRDEIFARGLRNPWRFSFDRGRIVIGDVGQNRFEEVDFERRRDARGANFGWDGFEGFERYDEPVDNEIVPRGHDRPIHAYSHSDGRCSITGGYVSRDRRIPSLFGRYLYADYCRAVPRSLVPRLDGARGDKSLGLGAFSQISTFGEDARNRIYFASLASGKVFRLVPR